MASYKRRAAGFSLVEVLVSIVVLSLGLLGAVGMLTTSVRSTSESGSFTAAVDLARELSEKARLNRGVAAGKGTGAERNPYLIDIKGTDPLPAQQRECVGPVANCSAWDIAAWDVRDWAARVKDSLPEGRAVVCFDDDPVADDGNYTWGCSGGGRNLVVKLGWVPRMGSEQEMGTDRRPRVVMQLVPGHGNDGPAAI